MANPEVAVLRGGPVHGRKFTVRSAPSILIAINSITDLYGKIHAVSLDSPMYRQVRYDRTNEYDKWGKRIYRIGT